MTQLLTRFSAWVIPSVSVFKVAGFVGGHLAN